MLQRRRAAFGGHYLRHKPATAVIVGYRLGLEPYPLKGLTASGSHQGQIPNAHSRKTDRDSLML